MYAYVRIAVNITIGILDAIELTKYPTPTALKNNEVGNKYLSITVLS